MKYENKYNLTREESIFLAKKNYDNNIYCGMKMENRAVTFPETQTILNGVNVPGVQLDDIQAILNMRDAWRFLLNSVDDALSVDYICKLNGYIARNEALEWGKLRNGSVGISGTDYKPPVPEKSAVENQLNDILASDRSNTEKALDIFLWGARSQLFWDGNKRTSLTAANKLLVTSGCGIMTVTDKYMERFNTLLLEFYNSGEGEELKAFLYENAIFGIDF